MKKEGTTRPVVLLEGVRRYSLMEGLYLVDERTTFPKGTTIVLGKRHTALQRGRKSLKKEGTSIVVVVSYRLPSADPEVTNPFRTVHYPTYVIERELAMRIEDDAGHAPPSMRVTKRI